MLKATFISNAAELRFEICVKLFQVPRALWREEYVPGATLKISNWTLWIGN